jgi:adenylate kinase
MSDRSLPVRRTATPALDVTHDPAVLRSSIVHVVLIGPPGAGKGTQAGQVASAIGVPVIATGDILRSAARSDSPAGRSLRSIMERGELIDDSTITNIVTARLANPDAVRGCVLDGFPRTVDQAIALDGLMGQRRLVVVELAVPAASLVQRLSQRRVCEQCGTNAPPARSSTLHSTLVLRCGCGGALRSRCDDAEEVVRERLRVYERSTRPLIDFYRQRGLLRVVDGTLDPDLVTTAIIRSVQEAMLPALVRR